MNMVAKVAIPFSLILATPILASAQDEQPNEVRCNYDIQFRCNESGCQTLKDGEAFLLVPKLDTILDTTTVENLLTVRRCDEIGCTPVTVIPKREGIFLNMTSAEGGYLLKLMAIDVTPKLLVRHGDFVEIATLFLDVWISYGNCTEAVEK